MPKPKNTPPEVHIALAVTTLTRLIASTATPPAHWVQVAEQAERILTAAHVKLGMKSQDELDELRY